MLGGWLNSPTNGSLWVPAWAASHRDTAGLRNFLQQVERAKAHLPPQAPPIAHDIVGYLVEASKAYLALARADSTTALTMFLALPDSACFNACRIDELQRVQLLEAHGRSAEALVRLTRHLDGGWGLILPSEVRWGLERGRGEERLGHQTEAVAAYAYVRATWANADSLLQPFVSEARAGIARLSGEPRH